MCKYTNFHIQILAGDNLNLYFHDSSKNTMLLGAVLLL